MPDQNPDRKPADAAQPADAGEPRPGADPDVHATDAGAAAEGGASARGDDPVAALTAALEQARQEAADAQDQALRAHAESENVRRRTQREIDNARKYALEKFALELLPVLDSLERAVESCQEAGSETTAAIAEGVELSLKLFTDVLTKAGIQQVDPLGAPFDPQRHEAMSMVESDAEPGTVVSVLQKGYTLNDRLLRAAMVMVAKAPPSDKARHDDPD